ncbi:MULTISPECIES: ATP-dependent Clp protease proteolytic subunit [Nannocystis]|uniref:ATP-dependent Clp protease proteolytic subunit n=2 Tax=Nannocystis TaxID=53 RepID=A0ABS7TUF6_9BACT|nr:MULTISPECIES: ATP-dependent Clp protease proteolytic subunit [Nannocystis]MBZ5711853.1 ATP-dependent Clp protease proteolytic subunit [Nannocystis pusilla]MCY1060210.1 ATP-dependent Clp protease proteolytic subunit [Nannocystis sp. SCPEA4]MDC0666181.1 ATP-dependent Clp protease proteolytic subunit [Nannocystis radixulma]
MLDPDSDPNEPQDDRPRAPALADEVRRSLLKSRTVLIFGEITSELAQATTAQLLALASESEAPIRIVIHSPGGHVESGDTIHDVIRFIRPEVTMIGSGWVASAGALIFVAARRENRIALPNTRFLLHQPSGGLRGAAADIEIEAVQIAAMRARLNRIFAAATGQDLAKLTRETERNLWMSAREAQAYGLVHRVIESVEEV